jgi:hypothetical protein
MVEPMQEVPETLGDDLLEGVARIAWFVGLPVRRTHYLLKTGRLPGGKLGGVWVGSKSQLRALYERITSGRAA